jgi:hypothetical protein
MQFYGDLIHSEVPVLAAGNWGGFVGNDLLQGRLITSHSAFRVLRKWEIREKLSAVNVQVPACIASTFVLMSKQTCEGSVGDTAK